MAKLFYVLYGLVGAIIGAIVGACAAFLYSAVDAHRQVGALGLMLVGYGLYAASVGAIIGTVLAIWLMYRLQFRSLPAMSPQHRRQLAALLSVQPLLLAGGMVLAANRLCELPTDLQMIENFEQHRSTFDQLARMAHADSHVMPPSTIWLTTDNFRAKPLTQSRHSEYQRLLKKAEVNAIQGAGDNASFCLWYWDDSFLLSSSDIKGYAFLTTPPKYLSGNLDHCPDDGPQEILRYRHLQGNWYLYFEYAPGS